MINRSAEKRERQNSVRRMRNRAAKSTMRTAIKKFEAAVASDDKDTAASALALSLKLLDTTASKGIIHQNTASRKKSRLQAKYNKFNNQAAAQA
ncbi:MAG: 30S ribosomal protein S20 [Sphaerochaeta sp.]|uniref:30S ribosomal protein S20 n=1 Tax=unclassified Sphaerochaeta TaxID=2637943 RepID=UPI000E967853|nr:MULTISPECIES: 30S ribosomal protein S20 [unclassified Sphaerochaeta]MCK9598466.1 30S ribosomal protein S20 [Sphaerochaeta sp.]MEA4864864.1 30S ribosomal protein S20 [Sphaerochaeta sp.]HAP56981.1 30S ribosomal protein S20 [Sphaerochaeta sp.]HBO35709.1 30S ribosomal protein S20 [Sphaerochaeta sp.]HCU29750.1 30S ribosomal protein S20 [Sphaerochaeta sp.]